jgi:TRAP-type C4-dicarboxylate transport system permease small subunit
MTLLHRLSRLIERLSQIGGWIAAVAVLGILGLVSFEIVSRSLFGYSTQVSDEFSGYLNVAVIYFGLAYALKEGAYVRVEPVYRMFRGPWAIAVRWLIVLASLAYMLVTTVFFFDYTVTNFEEGIASTSFSQTPLWIPQVAIVVGSALLVLQLAAYLLRGGRDVP